MTDATAVDGQGVTAVVCCYTEDRWDDVLRAVNGLFGQTEQPGEVLIVVDHNETLRQRLVAEFGDTPAVRVVANSGPQGLSGARNTAIESSDRPFVAFLDDDAAPDAKWLEHLMTPFRTSPRTAISGGRSQPGWPEARPKWFPEEFDWVVGSSYRGMPTQTTIVRNVHGCSMLFRRTVFDEVGGFADGVGRLGTLPLGCEETELCIRLTSKRPDDEIWYVPESLVLHRVSEPRTHVKYFIRRCYAEGISKAQIGKLVGNDNATSTERSYVTETLRSALQDSLSLTAREKRNVAKAAAIVVGLTTTVVGYGRGRLRWR